MAIDRERALELLPWYLNGTLEREEREEVEAALAEDPALREALSSTAATGDLFASAPSTEVLVAYAAGELDGAAQGEVAEWLRSHDDERELVTLAKRGLSSGFEGGGAKDLEPRDPGNAESRGNDAVDRDPSGWRGWPQLAAAALVLAAIASGGWWQAHRALDKRSSPAALTPIPLVELAPEETRRGGEATSPKLAEGPVTLLLVVTRGERWDRTYVELRADDGAPLERREVQASPDGFVSVLFDSGRLPTARRLVLLGERGGELETIHEYALGG